MFIALVTQKLTDIVKAYLPDPNTKFPIPRYIALVISVLLSFSLNADILTVFGFHSAIPYLGVVLTGVATSMGASYLNDILGLVNAKASPPQFLESTMLQTYEPPTDVTHHGVLHTADQPATQPVSQERSERGED